MASSRPALVQSVDRAVAVIEILARDGVCTVTDIARELGTNKSTVSRILATLETRGVVEKSLETQRYRLGFAILTYASGVRTSLDLNQAARPACERLSRRVGETVNIAVLEDGDVVNIQQVNFSTNRVNVDWTGSYVPLHATSSGKVLIAHLPEEERERLLTDPLKRFTAATITRPARLRSELDRVREQGYATALEEFEAGLCAIAAPIRDAEGAVIAAISLSAPSVRMQEDQVETVAEVVMDAAADISRRLGYLQPEEDTGDPAPGPP